MDQHRDMFRVEPICKVLRIAPSGYRHHAAQLRDYHRLMEPLGYIPPAEAEASYYRQLQMPATEPLFTYKL
ncbi:transposase [Pandoraea horticolens]|uniref:Transposase n=1 Tax=Pandoraea horticolens TaxID=2508298 RepID=A0A5E4UM28_9BURK|nr:hypothetical protein [Pandoraea horticolens]VVE00982.1 transposase [Pandoraea horticolens]